MKRFKYYNLDENISTLEIKKEVQSWLKKNIKKFRNVKQAVIAAAEEFGLEDEIRNRSHWLWKMFKKKTAMAEEQGMDPTDHVRKDKKSGMYCVYNKDGKMVKEFKDKKDADKWAIDNHDSLMEKLRSILDIDPRSKQWRKAKHTKTGKTIEIHPFDGDRFVTKTSGGGMEFIRKASVKESVELDEAQKRTFKKGDRVVGRRGNFKDLEAKVINYDWRLGELIVAVKGKKVRVSPSDWNKIRESIELEERTSGPTRMAIDKEFTKMTRSGKMDTIAAIKHVEKMFKVKNVKVARDKNGKKYVISFNEGETIQMKKFKSYIAENKSVELDEAKSFRDYTTPASPKLKKWIESGKQKYILNVASVLGPTTRFVVVENPNWLKSRDSKIHDKVLMFTISDPKKGRIKMFAFHGSHVSHQKAMQFAKNNKLVAKEDAKGNPLYAKESVELDEYRRSDVYVIVDKKGKVVVAKLTKKNAHKEISRHQDGTIVLDPDAKTGDVLKTFAKESVELNEMENAQYEIRDIMKKLGIRGTIGSDRTVKVGNSRDAKKLKAALKKHKPGRGAENIKSYEVVSESVELDEAITDDRKEVAKELKKFAKKYVSGRISVTSGKGKTAYVMLRTPDGEISNELRKMVINKAMPKANVKNMDDISYGNVTSRSIAIGSGDWKKVMGMKESVEHLDESTPAYRKMMKAYKGSDTKKVFDILKKKGFRAYAQSDTLVRNMLKKNKGNVQKAAAEIEKKYPNHFKESVELDERTSGPSFQEVTSKGKRLGEWNGWVYFEYKGILWSAKSGTIVNNGKMDGPKVKHLNKAVKKAIGLKESVELDEKKKKKGQHDCATHVEHAQHGMGTPVKTMHATPDESGHIEWYDVMFEHGIEKKVYTKDLRILASEMHENHDAHG